MFCPKHVFKVVGLLGCQHARECIFYAPSSTCLTIFSCEMNPLLYSLLPIGPACAADMIRCGMRGSRITQRRRIINILIWRRSFSRPFYTPRIVMLKCTLMVAEKGAVMRAVAADAAIAAPAARDTAGDCSGSGHRRLAQLRQPVFSRPLAARGLYLSLCSICSECLADAPLNSFP